MGQILAQREVQPRALPRQAAHEGGHDKRPDGGNDAQPQQPAHRLTRGHGHVEHALQGLERVAGLADHPVTQWGEHDFLAHLAVEQFHIHLALKGQYTGGKRGLGYSAGPGRAAEMAQLGQRDQITELLGGRHRNHR